MIKKRVDLAEQVAIITGGGRGIGRATAVMLAHRGAAIVVNDIGSDPDGGGFDQTVAEEVAVEIRNFGGHAVASVDDITNPAGGAAVVETAIDTFGRVDIVVHSAGIGGGGPFRTLSLDHFRAVLDVHLHGAIHVLHPAWNNMVDRGYGRIILMSSSAIFGMANSVPYSTAKAALLGLTSALRAESETSPALDIKVNAICPTATTRRGGLASQVFGSLGEPDQVAAVITYLASPGCTLNGTVLHAGASHVARIFLGLTRGWAKGSPDLTVGDVRDHLDDVTQSDDFSIPGSPIDVTRLIAAMALNDPKEANARVDSWLAELG